MFLVTIATKPELYMDKLIRCEVYLKTKMFKNLLEQK